MQDDFKSIHSEVLVFIGAGATASLKMPQTYDQTKIFRTLSDKSNADEARTELLKWFSEPDLSKIICFLNLLYGTEKSIFEISEKDLKNAKAVYRIDDDKLLRKRILELRSEYDWNAAKKVLNICPSSIGDNDNLILDVYSIIDKKILTGQSLKVVIDGEEEIISPSRLQAARNFLILFVNMMFASAWHTIIAERDADLLIQFEKYKKFINSFDRIMQKEGRIFFSNKKHAVQNRDFYLFTSSFVSFNFEMVFPWIFMMSHKELNQHAPLIKGDHPLKLWLDYGCEHRGRKTIENTVVPTLEFTESVASRENEDGTNHVGTELNRTGKFYFAHGSSNWRECPICGRMTFYFGYSDKKWNYKSKELIPLFPIPIFGTDKIKYLTKKETEWRKELRYDSVQCMHCGAETKALDAPMIMQTMYKSTPTSFLEEIQRNVKVSLANARHIVLLGYRLPPDDTIWYQSFAEAIRAKNSDNAAYCTVVVGYKGRNEWLYKDELEKYVKNNRKEDNAEDYGVSAIESAWAIFGKENVRAWTGGIPQVFGSATENDVKELLYPKDFVDWKETRLE